MKVKQHSSSKLIIEETAWKVAAFAISLILLQVFYLKEDISEKHIWIIGSVFLLGFWFFTYKITIIFDKTRGIMSHSIMRIIIGSKKEKILFNEIDDIIVHLAPGAKSKGLSYRVIAILKNGNEIPFSPLYSSGKSEKEEIAVVVREFLQIKSPGNGNGKGSANNSPTNDKEPDFPVERITTEKIAEDKDGKKDKTSTEKKVFVNKFINKGKKEHHLVNAEKSGGRGEVKMERELPKRKT